MTVRGMIFDVDGTLANTIPVCCAAFREATRERAGRDYSDPEIIALFGPSEEGIIRSIVGDGWEACVETFHRAYEAAHDACVTPFPGIVGILETLAVRNMPLAIVTGKGQASAVISLRRLDLARHFAMVETGSPAGPDKPAAIRRTLQAWGMKPDEAAYVGDSPHDMRDAHATGTIPLAAAWAPGADEAALRAERPRETFASVAAFAAWIVHNVEL